MSYVDAIHNRDTNRIHVVERKDGIRELKEFPAIYEFYYDDPKGKYTSVYDTPLSKISCRTSKEFYKELKIHGNKTIYEGDINPVVRFLSKNYKDADSPNLHVAFFDIETDFDHKRGFSPPSDPFNKVTAISLYLAWLGKLVCLVIPPPSMTKQTASEIVEGFDNTFIFYDEKDLLTTFLDLIDDADVLSGWNSDTYDIPYLVNRVTRVMSKNDTRRFCLWDKFPKKHTFERYGTEQQAYILSGRIHLDYMDLYRKYTYQEMHSYALDAIAEHELDDKKVVYNGTLDQLYNQDFKKFIEYSRKDTFLLYKLDNKLKFLDLANELAHANTILIPATAGAVAVTEQAIINEAHERGYIVPNKNRDIEEDTKAAGAYVAHPKKGIHKWVGSVDINSLYPSVIRALNMAPETIIGQIQPIMTDQYLADKIKKRKGQVQVSFAGAWEGLFGTLEYTAVLEQTPGVELTVAWENADDEIYSAKDLYNLIFHAESNWSLSANGTIFSYRKNGIIPGLLERWYAERKELQAKLRKAITPEEIIFWDKRQLVKKINLNSLYGAILNPHCRFYDKRIGQSTTLTGRAIAKHMDAHINECLTGEYDHTGECIIYGDTDSAYFSAWPILKDSVNSGNQEWNKDITTELYENIAERVNVSFPHYMEKAHHTPRDKGDIIKCGREITAETGLFITKKRYAVLVYDNEGTRYDINGDRGKVKAMGLDLKRSDTPPIVQRFLSEILLDVLCNHSRDSITSKVKEFKYIFKDQLSWEKGTPKRVNNLTKYGRLEEIHGKTTMPGHVRAALNWNTLRKMNSDNYSTKIMDGMKIIVCRLSANPLGWVSVGYPTDEVRIPDWFKELPFDTQHMEKTLIDKKIDNLLGVLNWNIVENTNINNSFQDLFEL